MRHLFSGEPFIVQVQNQQIVAPTALSAPSFKTIKEWTDFFSSRWTGEEPNLWLGRLKDETQLRFHQWLQEGNSVTLENYESVAKQFPKTYISIVANEPDEISMVEEVFAVPAFIPKSSFSAAPSMWMYAGLEGAGVDEHIDTIGCVCSWSYMLFGKKRWWFRTPPGMTPQKRTTVLQEEGDFIFWCVGYFHQTQIESEESLDVHGYVSLDVNSPGSFANRVGEYANIANYEWVQGGAPPNDAMFMHQVSTSCSWGSIEGTYIRIMAYPPYLALVGFIIFALLKYLLSGCRRCVGGQKNGSNTENMKED